MYLIAVWGSSGAGKTTLSQTLGAALAQKGQDTLVLSADTRAPALPVYLPELTGLKPSNSLGELLTRKTIDDAAMKDRIHKHPRSDRLYFMGLISGELAGISYPVAQRASCLELFRYLRDTPFRFVIVDCDSNPVYDPMTLAALETAQLVLRVMTPDVKGYEFQKAQLAWLRGNESFGVEGQIRLLNPVFAHTPVAESKAVFGDVEYVLPYASQVAKRQQAGQLLRGFDEPASLRFEAEIERLTAEILWREEGYGG